MEEVLIVVHKNTLAIRNAIKIHFFSTGSLILVAFILIAVGSGCMIVQRGCENIRRIVRKSDYHPIEVRFDEERNVLLRMGEDLEMRFVWMKEMDLWISQTEVSMRQYDRFKPPPHLNYLRRQPGFSMAWPVIEINDFLADEYCNWLSRSVGDALPAGYIVRIPTVEEWEAVAKAGDERIFPWGDEWPPASMVDGTLPNCFGVDNYASLDDDPFINFFFTGEPYKHPVDLSVEAVIPSYIDGYPGPCPVIEAGANPYGIVGLAGNAYEWCLLSEGEWVLKGGSFRSGTRDNFEILDNAAFGKRPNREGSVYKYSKNYETGLRVVIARPIIW